MISGTVIPNSKGKREEMLAHHCIKASPPARQWEASLAKPGSLHINISPASDHVRGREKASSLQSYCSKAGATKSQRRAPRKVGRGAIRPSSGLQSG